MATKYDLHCHSDFSDGILSPEALVSRASANKVTHLALTDHDTTAGLAQAKSAAQQLGITLIPGIEFSTQWYGRGIHIVGLFIDPTADALQQAEAQQRAARFERARQIAARLEAKGICDTLEGAMAEAGQAAPGRPHFARHLVARGAVKSIASAFKQYLGAGKAGDVKQVWPDIDTAIAWINQSGGIAVLAHPLKYTMTRTKLRALVDDFVDAGGGGIELICGAQKPGMAEDMLRLADAHGLYASCGSDFHAPGQPWQELGSCPNLPIGARPVWEFAAA